MKKKFGITFGGLQQKIFNLVLIFLLALIGVFAVVSAYQANKLSAAVNDASSEQQAAINNVSENTMHQLVDKSLTKTNAMQAYIADDMFLDVKTDVATLQSLATVLFAHKDSFESFQVYPPDKANDGKYTAQVLHEKDIDYTKSEYLGVAAHMSDTMVAMCEGSDYMNNCFIGFADGILLCVDSQSANKFDVNGEILPFPVRERPWYIGAVEAGQLWFSGIEIDTYTDKIGIECAAPVYADGKLIAVVGADLFLDEMTEYVNNTSEQGRYVGVINNVGQVIFAPEGNGVFDVLTADKAEDLRESDNENLAEFVSTALKGKTGLTTVNVNGKDYYMTGDPIPTVGWAAVSFIEKDITEQSSQLMISEFERINKNASDKFEGGTARSKQTTLVMIAVILILGSVGALVVAGRIVKPIERMTKRIGEINGTDISFEMEDTYRTNDEIQVLAESFETLSKRTREYINQITKITAEKERIGAELDLATNIQTSMLPNFFPAFPERNEFELYASMDPAKEVGGDFYDFFLIDDDHLAIEIADVSGKGIPAALFMMAAKILITDHTLMGGTPAEILTRVNKQICATNDANMFVTVWLGIIEISTGKLTAANAGHEYPMLNQSGSFEIVKDKHGLPIGASEMAKYKDYELTLKKGDSLFVYTDGVAEATNANNELFGMERTITALNTAPDASPEDILRNIRVSVDKFVKEAPQFDDLTMLAFRYLGKKE